MQTQNVIAGRTGISKPIPVTSRPMSLSHPGYRDQGMAKWIFQLKRSDFIRSTNCRVLEPDKRQSSQRRFLKAVTVSGAAILITRLRRQRNLDTPLLQVIWFYVHRVLTKYTVTKTTLLVSKILLFSRAECGSPRGLHVFYRTTIN
jgi:hypothetical protein